MRPAITFLNIQLSNSRVGNTGILTKDLGTILVGGQAVEEGLIDSIGGIHEAFAKLHQLIQETKSGGKKSF